MTDNLIGKRVRATLGENLLVGTVTHYAGSDPNFPCFEAAGWYDNGVGIDRRLWTIEPLPDPLPTAPYSLVVPPAEDPSSFPYVLVPFANTTGEGSAWWSGMTKGNEATVESMVRDHGWRVIPGPPD